MLSDQTVQQVHDLASLLDLLRKELGWPLPIEAALEDVTFDWTAAELRLQEAHAARLRGGVVRQLRPLAPGQPWGVFLVEFADGQVYRTALRQVLRGLVPHRRRDPTLPAWQHENLLFLCTTRDYDRFTFAHFRGQDPRRAVLARFEWERDDTHLRTLCEYNLPALRFPDDGGTDPKAWLEQWRSAFDVERVTRAFFAEYRQVFEQMERAVRGVPAGEARRLYTQRLLNRLMFLYFIQKKGWLSFQGDRNYLRALFQAAQAAGEDFLNDRLYWTFFHGLNTLGEDETLHRLEELRERRGDVPFLNGGLFDLEDDYDVRGAVHIPNEVFHLLLNLFERYNFTVTESTPLDIEVAVDPEMLGKIFEELVTGRHETGSYYTPRPVVAFMCREALKHYLDSARPQEEAEAVASFVDEDDPAHLRDPEGVLRALQRVRVCDPACGSGAYLLGMLHELFRLRAALFVSRRLDTLTAYQRKLEIIERNLYGVDLDPFAVNIAKLRLWLTLAVEFEGETPPPLPNLDFKIEVGDSLTAPNPQAVPDLFRHVLLQHADRLAELKGCYLRAWGEEKKRLAAEIQGEEDELRRALRDAPAPEGALDWRVAFAEVFAPLFEIGNGFDILLANPPYVDRNRLTEAYKDRLRQSCVNGLDGAGQISRLSDLYVYFFLRGVSLLRPGGVMCFICSGSWLDVGFGEGLQSFLLRHTRLVSILDSATQRTFSTADVNTTINFFVRDPAPPPDHVGRFVLLRGAVEEVATSANLRAIANATVPLSTPTFRVVPVRQGQLALSDKAGRSWGGRYLRAPDVFAELCALPTLVPTSCVARARLGVTTGANEFFFLKRLAPGLYESTLSGTVSLPDESLKPVIRSVSECNRPTFRAEDAAYYLLMVGRGCRDPQVLAYIRDGEAAGLADRPFFAGKACWYEIRQAACDPVAVSEISYLRYFVLWNPDGCVLNKNLYGFISDLPAELLYALIAWTPTFLFYELHSRKLGAGASGISVKVANEALLLPPDCLTPADREAVVEAATAIRERAALDVPAELEQPDRQALDERLLRAASAPADFRGKIYDALQGLVEARAAKAQSL